MVVRDIFDQQSSSYTDERKELLNHIQAENDKLDKARTLLLEDAIDTADYKTIKAGCESKLLSLEAKLTGYSKPYSLNLNGCIDKALRNLSQLTTIYKEADTPLKRNIIGSIYPEKLCFDGITYRTAKINDAAHLMLLINSKLDCKKNRTKLDFSSLSDSVAGAGLNSNQFFEDLKALAAITC